MKRIFLFLLTNILVVITLSILTSVLGVNKYLYAHGINYQSLAIFCFVWGMGGSLISLFISKWTAKAFMQVRIINPQQQNNHAERELIDLVHQLAKKAGITTMPEVGIYDSPELNAFATGPSKNNALVAVSTGLLNSTNRAELEGVLGHEISHVSNGDMVTMMLLQGVINAFTMFLSRVVAYAIATAMNRSDDGEERGPGFLYMILVFVFDIVFTLLGSLVTAAFSRYREYRADSGSASLTNRNNMIAALRNLQARYEANSTDTRGAALDTLKINGKSSWLSIFSTHPPLADRIARLETKQSS